MHKIKVNSRFYRFFSCSWIKVPLFGVAVSFLTSMSANAADDEDERAARDDVEEVVVTATRRDTEIMETPFSMQAFSGEYLESENILDTRDLYDYIPGLVMQEENSRNDHTVQMRGSGITSVSADDGQSAVGYYVDDVPWVGVSSQVSPNIDYFDVQRVEVLRGPQGTSFGQDATGGSIRVYTNDPDLQNFGYKVKAGYGNRSGISGNAESLSVVANLPLVEDTFAVRASYSYSYDPGKGEVQDRPDIDNPTEYEANNWRIKALWKISDSLDVTLSHSEWDWETLFFTSTSTISTDNGETILRPITNRATSARFTNGIPDNSATTEWTTLNIKWDLGWAEFTSSWGHAESIGYFNYDSGGPQVGILFDWPNETDSQEFRLVSTSDSPLQWLVGAYAHDSFQKFTGIVDIDYTVERDWFSYQSTYVETTLRASEAWSLYGEVSYEINDQWVVLAGLRYKEDDRKLGNDRTNRDPLNDPPEGNHGGHPLEHGTYTGTSTQDPNSFSFDNFNPRINVTYYPTNEGMIYLNAATGFRAPIFLRSQQMEDLEAGGFSNFVSSDGTEVTSIEIGTKWSLFDKRLTVQASIAQADWQDVPVGVSFWVDDNSDGTDDREASGVIPGGDAEITSYEWDLMWRATDSLSFGYTGAYIDGEITDDSSDIVSSYPLMLLEGNDTPLVAEWTHAVRASYNAPLMDTGWYFFSSLNWSHRSRPYAAWPTERVPAEESWENVNLTLGVRRGAWTIDLSAQNLTDMDEAFTAGSAYRDAGGNRTVPGVLPTPRTWMLQVSYNGFSN